MTKMKLDQLGLVYTVINCDEDEAAAQLLRDEGWMATPVVKVAGSPTQSWSGYRPDLIAALAERLKP
jgi:glutaredoxin-like protein NrdH